MSQSTMPSYGRRFIGLACQLTLFCGLFPPLVDASQDAGQSAGAMKKLDWEREQRTDSKPITHGLSARPSITIESTADGGFVVDTVGRLRNELSLGKQYSLLKIDGVCVKGRSLSEVEQMIAGPSESKVELTLLLTIYGELSVEILPRMEPETERHYQPQVGSSLNMFDIARYGSRQFKGDRQFASKNAALSAIAEDCRYIAAACYLDLLDGQPMVYPKTPQADVNVALPDMLQFFYDNALFANAEKVSERCVAISKSPSKLTDEELNALLRAAEILMNNDNKDCANTIFTTLLPAYEKMSVENQAQYLASYGQCLRVVTSVNQADSLARELAAKADGWHPRGDHTDYFFNKELDPLEVLAAFYLRSGQYTEAIDRYKSRAKKQTHSVQNRYSLGSVFTTLPPLVRTLQSQAQCYILLSDFKSAVETLRNDIRTCQYEMNDEQQLLFEESNSPGISDLKLDLAKALLKSNDANAAHVVLLENLHEIEDRLGSASPALYPTIKCLLQIDKLLDLSSETSVLEKRFASLKRTYPQFTATPDHKGQSLEQRAAAKHVYDVIVAHNLTEAERLIKQLIELELGSKIYRDNNVTSILNLIKLYGQRAPCGSYLKMLHSLDPLFVGSADVSANRVFQLTEIALSSVCADKTFSPAWGAVASVLQDVIQAQLPVHRALDKSDLTLDWELMRRFKTLAAIYACYGEPVKSVKIMEYAISRCDEKISVEPLLWLASFQVECGNFDKAQQNIDLALVRSSNNGNTISEPIIAICNAYQTAGRGQAAEKVLLAGIAQKKQQSFVMPDYALENRLTDLRQTQGRPLESVQVACQAQRATSRSTTLEGQYHEAALFAATKQDDKAIDLYLNNLCSNIRDPRGMEALAAAFKLLRRKSDIDAATMSKFVADLNNMYPGKATDAQANLLEQALDFVISHNASAKDIQAVTADLAAAYSALNRPKAAEKIYSALGKQLEQEDPRASCSYWEDAARCLMRDEQYDQGCELMLHAMSLPGASSFYLQMYHPGNMRAELGIGMLVAAARHDLAEKILRKGIQLGTANGAMHREPLIERLLLAEVLIDAGKYDEAWVVLGDLFTAVDKPNGEFCKHCDEPTDTICSCLTGLIDLLLEKQRVSDAARLARVVIEMQEKWLGSNNPQFIDTLRRLGNVQRLSNERSAAAETLKRALDIAIWNYGSGGRSVTFSRIDYAGALIALGKKDDADKVAACHPERMKRSDFNQLYGTRFMHHSTPPEHFADSAEIPLTERLDECRRVTGEGSRDTYDALSKLIQYYKERLNWTECEKLQLCALRTCELKEGRCSRQKKGCLLDLADTSFARGDRKKALEWLSKSESGNSDDWMDETHVIQYASLLLRADRKAEAIKTWRQVLLKIKEQSAVSIPSSRILDDCLNFAHAAGLNADEQFLNELKSRPRRGRF
jgi:hypothetical protein